MIGTFESLRTLRPLYQSPTRFANGYGTGHVTQYGRSLFIHLVVRHCPACGRCGLRLFRLVPHLVRNNFKTDYFKGWRSRKTMQVSSGWLNIVFLPSVYYYQWRHHSLLTNEKTKSKVHFGTWLGKSRTHLYGDVFLCCKNHVIT